jgi:hypothetical protein
VTEPVAEDLQAQRDFALAQLAKLERRGAELHEALLAGGDAAGRQRAATSLWQQDCAAAIHQLAGGSKAHWLSRAFSDALMVRSAGGGAVVEADLKEIVLRIGDVLARARQSLSRMEEVATASSAAVPAQRFEFVHNAALRPVLEQAFEESSRAFEERDFARSLITSCSILESILADALEHCGLQIADCRFDARIAAAEKAGLIRGGCARLPAVAREYRDDESPSTVIVTAREAKVARQVLHVVMRDLNPGR